MPTICLKIIDERKGTKDDMFKTVPSIEEALEKARADCRHLSGSGVRFICDIKAHALLDELSSDRVRRCLLKLWEAKSDEVTGTAAGYWEKFHANLAGLVSADRLGPIGEWSFVEHSHSGIGPSRKACT